MLHEVFDAQTEVSVVSWGETNDKAAHEWVTITLIVAATLPAVTYLGNKLVEKGVEKAASEFIDWVFHRLGKEPEKKIADIVITFPNGSKVEFNVPSQPGTFKVWLHGKTSAEFEYERQP